MTLYIYISVVHLSFRMDINLSFSIDYSLRYYPIELKETEFYVICCYCLLQANPDRRPACDKTYIYCILFSLLSLIVSMLYERRPPWFMKYLFVFSNKSYLAQHTMKVMNFLTKILIRYIFSSYLSSFSRP